MTTIWIALFCLGSLATLYVLFGYPVLLRLLATRRARPIAKEHRRPAVSVVIPVHNGAAFLAAKLESVLALDYPAHLVEIFVVSDGSTDGTDRIAGEFAPSGVRLLRVPRGGKPAALNAAIPHTSGEILVLTDVRQALAPDSLQWLVDCFADPSVGVVSGELVIRSGITQDEQDTGLYWRYESRIREHLAALDSIFGATGPFYALRRELFVPIPPDMLLDDVYLPLSAFFRGYRLVVETRARAYDYPTSRHTEFRRKVRTLAGNYQILLAYPRLLTPSNRMWFHFVSYKLGRLLLPFALLAVGGASFGLPAPWSWAAIAMQAVLYALALFEPLLPEATLLRRLASLIRTFVVLVAAALCALAVFFVPARSLWKETRIARHSLEPPVPPR